MPGVQSRTGLVSRQVPARTAWVTDLAGGLAWHILVAATVAPDAGPGT